MDDDTKPCPVCGHVADPDDPATVRARKTGYVGFVADGGMRPVVTERRFHPSCYDDHRTGWERL